MILMLSDGRSYAEIQDRLQTTAPTISRWKNRFLDKRITGLIQIRHPGQRPRVITPKLQARVLEATRRKPKDGSTHCSVRKLASKLKISKDTVHRIWRTAGVKPHRLERYMASDDPDFEAKAADLIGLYLNPPQHAAVFCVDEKSAIQALDRLDPVLPLSPGRIERHGFEYFRHGTLSLYAALDVKSGKVHGKTAARHTSEEFVDFLSQVVALCKPKQEIHIIVDNLSAHKTRRVAEFLDAHSEVKLHFTPTYSSWLNQVEIWFARIEREVIARGVFTSVKDLARKLMRYIQAYSKDPRPFRWRYSDPTKRIKPC
jgi:transposase